MKSSILAFSLLGLVGCFLPVALGLSWFDMRHFDAGWHIWLVIAAFALPAIAAGTDHTRVAAIVGTASFGYLVYTFGTGMFDLLLHASIGGIMMGVAVIGGLGSSLVALGGARQR